MTIHHWLTVVLIFNSWYLGIMQCGCIIMFLHDNSDCLLAAAKICKYLRWQKLANCVYFIFVASWIVFRMVLLFWKVLYSAWTEAADVYDCHWLYWSLLSGISLLFCLHIYWFRMIIIVAFKTCFRGVYDSRSDGEDEEKE